MEHIRCCSESGLSFGSICSVWILDIFEVIVVFFEKSQNYLIQAWAAAGIDAAWASTDLATSMAKKARRANLSDFERYKLMRLKQQKARIVNAELGKLKKN